MPDDHPQPPHRDVGLMHALDETARQLARGGGLPGLAQQPIDKWALPRRGRCIFAREDLLAVFVPGIHPVLIEGDVILDLNGRLERRRVTPGGILRYRFTKLDGPIAGVPLKRTVGDMFGPAQRRHAYVRARKIETRQVPGLAQHHDARRIRNDLSAEFDPHAFFVGLEIHAIGIGALMALNGVGTAFGFRCIEGHSAVRSVSKIDPI